MATGNPDVWQQRKRMHERYGEIPDTAMATLSGEEESDRTTSEESDDAFRVEPEESATEDFDTGLPAASSAVVAPPPRVNNKRKENERVVETLPETPKLSYSKVSKRNARDRSPTFRRREEKKRDKPTGRPAAVLGPKNERRRKKVTISVNREVETTADRSKVVRPIYFSDDGRQGVRKQLFPQEENAIPNGLPSKDRPVEEKLDQSSDDRPRKRFDPERRRYLSSNQLGAVFLCVEGSSYTVTDGITTISEDDVGNSWRESLVTDLENLGTSKNLFLVGNESKNAWRDIKELFPRSVRDTHLDDTHAGECTYCEKSDCHRWKVIVAGLQTMVKFKTGLIEH